MKSERCVKKIELFREDSNRKRAIKRRDTDAPEGSRAKEEMPRN